MSMVSTVQGHFQNSVQTLSISPGLSWLGAFISQSKIHLLWCTAGAFFASLPPSHRQIRTGGYFQSQHQLQLWVLGHQGTGHPSVLSWSGQTKKSLRVPNRANMAGVAQAWCWFAHKTSAPWETDVLLHCRVGARIADSSCAKGHGVGGAHFPSSCGGCHGRVRYWQLFPVARIPGGWHLLHPRTPPTSASSLTFPCMVSHDTARPLQATCRTAVSGLDCTHTSRIRQLWWLWMTILGNTSFCPKDVWRSAASSCGLQLWGCVDGKCMASCTAWALTWEPCGLWPVQGRTAGQAARWWWWALP